MLWIAQGLAPRINARVNLFHRTKLFPFHFALLTNDVSDVARLAVSIEVVELGIEWTIGGELDQSGAARNRRLHCGERHRLRLRAELGAAPADLGFEFLFLFFQCRRLLAEFLRRHLSR